MSSDIFSKSIPIEKFGLIYAGAQKNVGLAGTTLVIVRKDILGKLSRTIPTMLDYNTHIAKNSAFNTPPVLPIYTTKLNLDWIIEMGGVEAMEKRNNAKAELLYNEIDNNPLFKGTTAVEDRSVMNATFLLHDEAHKDKFLSMCDEAGIVGILGHRSVGGFRASMYNAMDIESVEVLVSVMKELSNSVG
jgi:phosphoserine aminotransferase